MHRLANPVQHYAWGSTTAIPEYLGAAVDGAPVAEVWMGAHPLAPSLLVPDDATPPFGAVLPRAEQPPGATPVGSPLDVELEARPDQMLGAAVTGRWGPRLPFLLKLLAAGEPLSLQVHPTLAQAGEGFAREEASGIDRTAPARRYRDPWHKPELVLALSPFRALCGFREPASTLAVLEGLGDGRSGPPRSPTLLAFCEALRRDDPEQALRAAFDVATGAGIVELAGACEELARACEARLATTSEHLADDGCVVDLQRAHPADAGVLLSTLLHHVTLDAGECLYLGPGQVHAYLSGLAVEAMACSDNVLRAGLTHKHVDVAEIRSVTDFGPAPVPRLEPILTERGVSTFAPPVDDVALDVVDVALLGAVAAGALPEEAGPRIVLGLEGEVTLRDGDGSLVVRRGEAVFLDAGAAARATGAGILAVARVGRC